MVIWAEKNARRAYKPDFVPARGQGMTIPLTMQLPAWL